MERALVEFEHAGFSYGGTEVLRDVTFSVQEGAFCVVFGRPGAGKSTLLRLCRAEVAPDCGMVRVLGWPVQIRDRRGVSRLRQRIGLIRRDNRFLDHLTLAENLAVPMLANGSRPEERGEDMAALLAWVGLDGHAAEFPCNLTPAEARRAAVARAVISGPELIIADEPVAGLSGEEALEVMSLILELHGMGMTVLLASSDGDLVQDLIAARSVQVAHLENGRLEVVT